MCNMYVYNFDMVNLKKIKKSSEYIKKAQSRIKDDESGNYTFRFNKKDMEAFRKICESNGITMTDIFRELIEDTLKNNSK